MYLLLSDEPHSMEHGSIKQEMTVVAHTFHSHVLFKADNSAVYDSLDTVPHGTDYAPTGSGWMMKPSLGMHMVTEFLSLLRQASAASRLA